MIDDWARRRTQNDGSSIKKGCKKRLLDLSVYGIPHMLLLLAALTIASVVLLDISGSLDSLSLLDGPSTLPPDLTEALKEERAALLREQQDMAGVASAGVIPEERHDTYDEEPAEPVVVMSSSQAMNTILSDSEQKGREKALRWARRRQGHGINRGQTPEEHLIRVNHARPPPKMISLHEQSQHQLPTQPWEYDFISVVKTFTSKDKASAPIPNVPLATSFDSWELPDHCSSSKKGGEIVIKGERHTGTNLMESILTQNLDWKETRVAGDAKSLYKASKYGWKHGM